VPEALRTESDGFAFVFTIVLDGQGIEALGQALAVGEGKLGPRGGTVTCDTDRSVALNVLWPLVLVGDATVRVLVIYNRKGEAPYRQLPRDTMERIESVLLDQGRSFNGVSWTERHLTPHASVPSTMAGFPVKVAPSPTEPIWITAVTFAMGETPAAAKTQLAVAWSAEGISGELTQQCEGVTSLDTLHAQRQRPDLKFLGSLFLAAGAHQ
jgi:hypothetical protein